MAETNVHGALADAQDDREVPEVDLLSPLTIRGVTLRNRIVMSPMCQYSSTDGFVNDWHLVHLGSRAAGGVSMAMVEASAVTPEGRISPADVGIWKDEHIEPLARIARFIEQMGAAPAIQLAHAGRKASTDLPWNGGGKLSAENGGWPTVAPSAVPFRETDPPPIELDQRSIDAIVDAFGAGARRAIAAGFRVLEIHAAHGYLLHEFLSPLSNRRSDDYGGSLANRMRLLMRVAERLRALMPADMPLFVRISATDWAESGGWDIDESVQLCARLKEIGVDVIDVSSGGTLPTARIPVAPGYQVPFAKRIRAEAKIMTAAVGLITEAHHANQIITCGDADLIFLARELLREPYWAIKAQQALGQTEPDWPLQYGYAFKRRGR